MMDREILSIDRLHTLLVKFKELRGSDYGLSKLGYFGSYANSTATKDSDIDIIFDTDTPNLFLTVMMKQDLEELFGCRVDVLQLRGLKNTRLKKRIEKEAVYV